MENPDVENLLDEISVYLNLLGENTFKVRAYERAARAVAAHPKRLADLSVAELEAIPGIGKAISEKIHSFCAAGRLPYADELRARIPPGLLEMLRIPSLGPKRAKQLYDDLKIQTIPDLQAACQEHRLSALKGWGDKLQDKILNGIRLLATFTGRHRRADVVALADGLLAHLRGCKAVIRSELAGSYRRRKEIVKDIDIVASSKDTPAVMEHFVRAPAVSEVIGRGDTKTSVRIADDLQADLRVVSDVEFPYALHHFTGSKSHNIAMRALAKSRGLKISEYGVFKGTKRIPAKDEAAFFKIFGMDFIPPEMREDWGEIDAARKHVLPELVTEKDIRGVLHVHTDWSDGVGTLETMARAAAERGYEYIAITDHSKAAHYANGLDEKRLEKQINVIRALDRKKIGIRVLAGSEVDILPDGRLDFPDSLLKQLDVVIAAVHSAFEQDQATMTRRLCGAMRNPHVDILAHPTARLLLSREGYEIDWEEIFKTAIKSNTAIELNANPHRLDIDPVHAKRAAELGVMISINPDAHRVSGLDDMRHGVDAARRGWLTRELILNARPLDRLFTGNAARAVRPGATQPNGRRSDGAIVRNSRAGNRNAGGRGRKAPGRNG